MKRAVIPAPAVIPGQVEPQKRPKRLRITTDRDAWLKHVKNATKLTREQAAQKLEERGKAIAKDRRRVWAGRAPELDDVNHGPPGLIAREERTGRAIDSGDVVQYEALEAGKTRVVWDPRKQIHTFVKAVSVEAHSERRGGTLPEQARWHFSRARNKRELFERVADCGKAETHKITVVCRECKHSQEIQVGCGSQWFCPNCRKRALSRLRKAFMRNRLGLITNASKAGLMRRKQKKGERWGERFLTLTLPHHGSPTERLEVLNQTWARFWRTVRDELRPKLRRRSGIVGESLPNGIPASKFENVFEVKRYYRAAATHRKGAPTLERHDAENTGDFELSLFDVLSYFRVIEWTPGDDGQGHPHVHVWLFSQFLEQQWLERLWREAWAFVQRKRLHELKEPKHGPIDERKTVVHIEASKEGVERELVKYLTKDWDVDGTGKARRVDPAVFAQVYAYLDGKRRRQSSAAFSMWAVDKWRACECCWYESERGTWCRVDITHALDHHKEPIGIPNRIGWYFDGEHYRPMLLTGAIEHEDHWHDAWEPDPRGAELRAAHDRKVDAAWLRSSGRGLAASRIAAELKVSLAWALTDPDRRPPLEFERIRYLCEGEPEIQEAEPDQLDLLF